MNTIVRKYWKIALAVVAALLLTYLADGRQNALTNVSVDDEKSIIPQTVLGLYETPVEVTKVYYKGVLLGVVSDEEVLTEVKQRAFERYYADYFPNAEISFDDDIYYCREKSYLNYETKDEEIADYIFSNDLFLVKAYRITFNDANAIYVKSEEEFRSALRAYVMSFVDSNVFLKLEKKENITNLTTYGQQDVNVYIEETIRSTRTGASAEQILKNEEEILNFLCYGRGAAEKRYYTVEPFDTVEGIATKFDMTAEQLIIINPQIFSERQALQEGSMINISLFSSPLTVVVEKQRYVKEVVYQEPTKYITDSELDAGRTVVDVEGRDGYRDTLYQDVYVNGKLVSYKQVSSKVVMAPVQKVIRVGNNASRLNIGDLQFTLPVTNPKIICSYNCYKGHTGTDFVDRYQRYGIVHACEDGVITKSYYSNLGGWTYTIDHGNNYVLRYGHMRTKGWYPVGTVVSRFQAIGDIGRTGAATTPHVHVSVYYEGRQINPCLVLPCDLAK